MRNVRSTPLAPYVDALPVPRRLHAADRHRRLTVHIRAATHRFHRDLPDSTVWGYDGSVPGPTIGKRPLRTAANHCVWRPGWNGP